MECSVHKVLIVAPIAVVKGVWRQEALEWPRTKTLTFSMVIGTPQQRLKALQAEADIYLTNYENLTWLFNLEEQFHFDAVVYDESTKLQSASSKRFAGKGRYYDEKKEVWVKAQKGVKHVAADFDYRYIVTGTPKPGEYSGLWSQVYCLDQGEALLPTITAFRHKWYYQYGPQFYQLAIRDDEAKEEIKSRLKDICYHIPRKEVAAVLPKVVERTYHVELPPKVRSVYDELEEDFFIAFDDIDEDGEEYVVTVANTAVLSNKLQQVTQGSIYDDKRNVKVLHHEKLDMLDALVSDLGSRNAIIIYNYQHDVDSLL